jgi:excisionase family DNA binding protein
MTIETRLTLTLREAAEALGLSESTLRHQIRNNSLDAHKRGGIWWVTAGEVERYRKESLGQHGKAPKAG